MCSFINKDNFKVSNFYRFPKALMSKRYDSLSLESKVAYSFFLDMVSLSIENDWLNEEGNVFVKIKRKDLMKKLGIKGTQKMVKIMSELKSFGLIVEEKVGFGRSNKIFLCDLESFENENSNDRNSKHEDFENQNTEFPKSNLGSFDFQKHNKTNINKTKDIKINTNKTQSNQDFSKGFDFKNSENKESKLKAFEKQNYESIKKDVDDERIMLNHKESKRVMQTNKNTKFSGIDNRKYDYDMETLDTARELLGWAVNYKEANVLLKEAEGNLYVLDLVYEKMIRVKGKIENMVGYLRSVLCC